MKAIYYANPTKAVRRQTFIHCLHDYPLNQLRARLSASEVDVLDFGDIKTPRGKPAHPHTRPNPEKFLVMPEMQVFGSHKNKNVDIVLSKYANGPLLAAGVRSQMSSVGKNITTDYEEIIGKCISIHDRFPVSVYDYVYLLPKKAYTIEKGKAVAENMNLDKYEDIFSKITTRPDWCGPKDLFEHFASIKSISTRAFGLFRW